MAFCQGQEQQASSGSIPVTSMGRSDAVADMTPIHDDVSCVSDPQFEMANFDVLAGKRHFESVGWYIVFRQIARILFDENQLEITVDQFSGIVESDSSSHVGACIPSYADLKMRSW